MTNSPKMGIDFFIILIMNNRLAIIDGLPTPDSEPPILGKIEQSWGYNHMALLILGKRCHHLIRNAQLKELDLINDNNWREISS